jgi:hypothetical protein
MWTLTCGINKRLTRSSCRRVRVKIPPFYRMTHSKGGDYFDTMRWADNVFVNLQQGSPGCCQATVFGNHSSGLCSRIGDYGAGQGNRQTPLKHPHDSGPKLRAICFNTSVVPCLCSLGNVLQETGCPLVSKSMALHAQNEKLIRSQTTVRLTNRRQGMTRTRVGRFSHRV